MMHPDNFQKKVETRHSHQMPKPLLVFFEEEQRCTNTSFLVKGFPNADNEAQLISDKIGLVCPMIINI